MGQRISGLEDRLDDRVFPVTRNVRFGDAGVNNV